MSKLSGLFGSLEKKVLKPLENLEQNVASKVENAVKKVETDVFEGAKKAAGNVIGTVETLFGHGPERMFASGRDGFLAVDANGQITGGQAAGVKVGDLDLPKSPLDSLLKFLDGGEAAPVTFTMPDGKTYSSKSDDSGHAALPLSQLNGELKGVDGKKGGIVNVSVSTPNGDPSTADMLVLPKDYDGPVFVCDIDDTLRDTDNLKLLEGKTQKPIAGAKELLEAVAAKGVPIIYLSAGPDRIRSQNEAFLAQLPKGVLLDRPETSVVDLIPFNNFQAQRQGDYKAAVLGDLKQTYPNAQLFGLGDDKVGDAMAYTRQNVTAYIHDVRAGDDNIPADFHGVQTKDYDTKFISKVSSDLQAAINRSASFGNTAKPVDRLAALSKELDKISGSKSIPGNGFTPYIDGENAFPQVLGVIDSAKKSLTYDTFNYVEGDKTTKEVTDHLIAAAKRGVKVSVLVDAIGGREVPPLMRNSELQRMRDNGVDVRIYNPVDSLSDLDYHISHRKTIVADGTTAMVGGMNTGDEYFAGPESPGRYHDAFAKLTGPAVQQVARDFADSWTADGGSPLPEWIANPPITPAEEGGVPVRVVAHTQDDSNIRATYLAMINNAQEKVNVENGYPMSDDLVGALCAAAQRGVTVNYVIGSDGGALGLVSEKNYAKLLDAGVHIYQYPTPIHMKALSVDGMAASIGSSNVDNASLSRNREIVAVVEDPAWVKKFDDAIFNKDLVGVRGLQTVELTKDLNVPLYKRALFGLLSLPFIESFE